MDASLDKFSSSSWYLEVTRVQVDCSWCMAASAATWMLSALSADTRLPEDKCRGLGAELTPTHPPCTPLCVAWRAFSLPMRHLKAIPRTAPAGAMWWLPSLLKVVWSCMDLPSTDGLLPDEQACSHYAIEFNLSPAWSGMTAKEPQPGSVGPNKSNAQTANSDSRQ